MTRQPTATSGSPAGASGMNALPTAARSIAAIATGPMPQRRVARVATTAPMNDDAPPTPAMTPEHGRARAAIVEDEQEPRRAEDAPQRRERHLGAGERAQDRVVADEPQAHRGSRSGPARGPRAGGGGASSRRIDPSRTADTR